MPIRKGEKAAHEGLCRRCGGCCHEKVRFGGQIVITDIPCEFLDPEARCCTVYRERFVKQFRCASVQTSIETGALPGDCPYVGGLSNYVEPHLLAEHPEYERAVNTLFPDTRKRTPRG